MYQVKHSNYHIDECKNGSAILTVFADELKSLVNGVEMKGVPKRIELRKKDDVVMHFPSGEAFKYFDNNAWHELKTKKPIYTALKDLSHLLFRKAEIDKELEITEHTHFPKADHRLSDEPRLDEAQFKTLGASNLKYMIDLLNGVVNTASLSLINEIKFCVPIAWDIFGFKQDGNDYVFNRGERIFYIRNVSLADSDSHINSRIRKELGVFLYHENYPSWEDDEEERNDMAMMMWSAMITKYLNQHFECDTYDLYNILVDEVISNDLKDEMLADFKFNYGRKWIENVKALFSSEGENEVDVEVSFK